MIAEQLERNKSEASSCVLGMARQQERKKNLVGIHASTEEMEGLRCGYKGIKRA